MTIHSSTQHIEDDQKQQVFQMISLLLQYPDEEWFDCQALCSEVAEFRHSEIKQCLFTFLEYLERVGLDEAMTNYVNTFDFNSKAALYLTYSNSGEERERGQQLLQLKHLYESAGLLMNDNELSDYLPLFLEFVAIAPLSKVENVLKEYQDSIRAIYDVLLTAESPYASILQACVIAIDELIKVDGTIR